MAVLSLAVRSTHRIMTIRDKEVIDMMYKMTVWGPGEIAQWLRHLLLLNRKGVWFSVSTRQLTTPHTLLLTAGMHQMYIHTSRQNTCTHKI